MLRVSPHLRHYGRYNQIVSVLVRHGFGDLLRRLRGRAAFRLAARARIGGSRALADMSYAERLRHALEELGPTFIKLGQVLASRPFLIPPELVVELEKLQDEVAPSSFDKIEKTITEEFGKPLSELYSEFSQQPIASASLAQVHLAKTLGGERVAVKVLHPGVRKTIQVDMEILRDIALLLERFLPESRQYEPVEQVEELARITKQEVDLYYEARNMDIFRMNFADDPRIAIPEVHWDLSRSSVLTTSVVDGIKISRVNELRQAGYDLSELASNGAQLVFKMIIDHRFFHADPHPGNLFALPGNRWAPVDFGMVGHLSESALDLLSEMLVAAVKADAKGLARVLASHDLLPEDVNGARLELDLTELLYRYHRISLKQINMKAIFNDARSVFTRHRIRLPWSLTLLVKAVVTYEEVGRMLDPQLNMIEEVEPHMKKLVMRKLDPSRVSTQVFSFFNGLSDFVTEAPVGIRRLTQKALRGELGLQLRHKGLDKLATDIDRASNRLSFSLIIAAIIVSSSLLISSKVGATVHGVPLLGVFGYLVAAAFGIWLVISIIRSGRF